MKFDEREQEMDLELNVALRNFRKCVHGWSEQEFSKARTIRRSHWDAIFRTIASPMMAWTMACSLLVASVGVPLTVHHQRQIAIDRQLAAEKQLRQEQARAAVAAESAMNDDELLSHVDSDIAQAAPDAMQPLAILMSDAAPANTEQ
jgi:hypothetical protein